MKPSNDLQSCFMNLGLQTIRVRYIFIDKNKQNKLTYILTSLANKFLNMMRTKVFRVLFLF